KATSQRPLALVSVFTPAPVDRQAEPVLTVLLSTRVPSAKTLFGLVVWAVKVAKVPAPARAPIPATTPMLRRTLRRRLSFMTCCSSLRPCGEGDCAVDRTDRHRD